MKKLFQNKSFIIIAGSIVALLIAIAVVGYFTIQLLTGAYTSCGEGEACILDLHVRTFVENDAGIYHVRYPNTYYIVTDEGGGKCTSYNLDNTIDKFEMSKKDYNYIVNYVESLPDLMESVQSGKYEPGDELYSTYYIMINYYTEDGELKEKTIMGYNEFPMGWNRFIDRVNKICGDEYLPGKGKVVRFSDALLTEWFGVTEDDVREGTLQDVIDYSLLDIYDITQNFSMQGYIEDYNVSVHEEWLEPYMAYELKEVESTEEEYNTFVNDMLERIDNPAWIETRSIKTGLRYFENIETGQYFYIGRTVDFEQMELVEPYAEGYPYGIVWAYTSFGTIDMYFVYSPCGKYIFACKECPEAIFDFLEIEY